jgi:TM2 domain-containing membrane protein YozV
MTEQTVIKPRPPKSPGLAGFLSLIFPGTGALYNGQVGKGIFYMVTFAGLVTIQTYGGGQPFKGLLLAGFYIFQFIESILAAKAINESVSGAQAADAGIVPAEVIPSGSVFWGAALIILGVLFTLANFDVIRYETLFDLWPLAVIIIGLKLVLDSVRKNRNGK